MAVTFGERDWQSLSGSDKKALCTFSRVALSFEPLATAPGVGQKRMDSLIDKGLAEEGEPGLHGRTFQLSKKGWLAVEWCNGNRMREYPESS
jgi:hypothetical protein